MQQYPQIVNRQHCRHLPISSGCNANHFSQPTTSLPHGLGRCISTGAGVGGLCSSPTDAPSDAGACGEAGVRTRKEVGARPVHSGAGGTGGTTTNSTSWFCPCGGTTRRGSGGVAQLRVFMPRRRYQVRRLMPSASHGRVALKLKCLGRTPFLHRRSRSMACRLARSRSEICAIHLLRSFR